MMFQTPVRVVSMVTTSGLWLHRLLLLWVVLVQMQKRWAGLGSARHGQNHVFVCEESVGFCFCVAKYVLNAVFSYMDKVLRDRTRANKEQVEIRRTLRETVEKFDIKKKKNKKQNKPF